MHPEGAGTELSLTESLARLWWSVRSAGHLLLLSPFHAGHGRAATIKAANHTKQLHPLLYKSSTPRSPTLPRRRSGSQADTRTH